MPQISSPAKKELPNRASKFDVVAMGASAGGLHALRQALSLLPKAFPGSIVVVQHLAPTHKSWMAELIGRSTQLKVKQAEHGEILLPGVVYVGPPDEHLLVGRGRIQLAHTQQVRFSRPSIDLLFESVAGTYGPHCIGVILSGSGKDGAAGIRTIKESEGTTIVQTPETAEFRPMPEAAIETGCVDFVLQLSEIGKKLIQLCCVGVGRYRNKQR